MECDSACVRRCHKVLKALDAPLEGWFCVGVLDHGVDSFTCELCDCKKVRYIHAMRHEHYLADIKVGCICAGVMEGDILAAQERDAEAKDTANENRTISKGSGMQLVRVDGGSFTNAERSSSGGSSSVVEISSKSISTENNITGKIIAGWEASWQPSITFLT